jgi:ABC-2 type transport system ATP-binding protein
MTATPTETQQAATAQTGDPVVKCLGLSKIFRDFWLRNRVRAVDNIDLTVHQGEVFGLLGPNGSGKSTTVKMILGLLHPTAGRIAVFGHHPTDVAMKKKLGYLPEESYLYPFLNARETLDYYGKLFHQDRRQRRQRIDMLLEMVGLDRVARRPIGEYSKGMQRRIGLAQALINDSQLLILDEPTTGLDPIGTRQIKDLIRQLAERGKTILLCSHLLADVEDVTDRVAIMFGGKIRQQGPVDQLLTRSGVTSVQAGALEEGDIEAIEQALAARGKHIEQIDHPRRTLESLFLDIVQQAQQEGAATSGAGSGGPMAEFLLDPSQDQTTAAESTDPGAVLDQLMESQPEAEQAPEPARPGAGQPAPESPAAEESGASAGRDVLDQLARPQPEEDETGPPAGPAASDSDASEPAAEHSVIDSLMGEAANEPSHENDQDENDRPQRGG